MANLSDALTMVGETHAGMEREHNEDAIWLDAGIGLAILADGMGGYNAGEVASSMAVACMSTDIRLKLDNATEAKRVALGTLGNYQQALLRDAALYANQEILETAQRQPECAGMGTTLVATLFHDNYVSVVHVGDARLYRYRHGLLEPLTKDHSLLQDQLDSGLITPEAARHVPYRNLVTRAVGVSEELEVGINGFPVEPDDLYLLCSDGLNDMLTDEEISQVIQRCGNDMELMADWLIQAANDAGGKDNVSVILIRVEDDFKERQGPLDWLMPWR
ncbi:Stp1/IreP family PP2C-type Ser/Thr phosphatase [Leeia oryzae]|uniref:Stp1/IreP family PP2C-type Ser/Thr phosphatase n=1 Tax=Leeia oryzae TaxID=356662 RepID=UPI00036B8D76|nr:Stp1/IreP family PP2C-type Ser/Thr phosphatase [Leeia oryzae]